MVESVAAAHHHHHRQMVAVVAASAWPSAQVSALVGWGYRSERASPLGDGAWVGVSVAVSEWVRVYSWLSALACS